MATEQDIIDTLESVRIDWSATPQPFLQPWQQEIHTQEDWERHVSAMNEAVGTGYFYANVQNMRAALALCYSTRPGYYETLIISQRYSPVLPEDLERAIEEAGGAIDRSGHYALDAWCLKKVRLSYLGGPSRRTRLPSNGL